MIYEKVCGAVVYTILNGRIHYVIIQQKEGFHGFPKGHVEKNETEEETALREIYEEVGLKSVLIKGFKVIDEYPLLHKQNVIKQVVYFLAEYNSQNIIIQEEELLGAMLLSYPEAMKVLDYESSRKVLAQANHFLCLQSKQSFTCQSF